MYLEPAGALPQDLRYRLALAMYPAHAPMEKFLLAPMRRESKQQLRRNSSTASGGIEMCILLLGQLFDNRVDLIKPVSNVRPFVRSAYVRTSIHKKFLRFQ